MSDPYKIPQNVMYDTDAENADQRYVVWRKVFRAYCTVRQCHQPIDKFLDEYKAANQGTSSKTTAEVESEYNVMNNMLYANILMCVTGRQLENVVLSDNVAEGDGHAAMEALENKNKGKAND